MYTTCTLYCTYNVVVLALHGYDVVGRVCKHVVTCSDERISEIISSKQVFVCLKMFAQMQRQHCKQHMSS